MDRAIQDQINDLKHELSETKIGLLYSISLLQKQQDALLALLSAEGACPIGSGDCYFPIGDPVPNRSQADNLDGNIYAIQVGKYKKPYKMVKNKTKVPLEAGQAYEGGIVAKDLRAPCDPNNFCLVEL